MIKIKRIYDTPLAEDGFRVLVDRLWPRGISKEKASVNEWLKDIGPSNELRKWFGHQPELFSEFAQKYKTELNSKMDLLHYLKNISDKENLTLVYSAKDEFHNQAEVILQVLNSL